MPTKPGFYAVRVGRVPGVYPTWPACQDQVLGYSCARFKKFDRVEDAWSFVQQLSSPRPLKRGGAHLELESRAVESMGIGQSKKPLRASLLPDSKDRNHANGSALVAPSSSKDPKGGKEGVEEVHVEKKVTKKRRRGHSESHGPVLKINEEGAPTLHDAQTTRKRPAKRTKISTTTTEGPLAAFFAQYADFEYNPAESATVEHRRLSLWLSRHDKQKLNSAKQGFKDALTLQFNKNYGTDVDDRTRWQALCAKLGMDPIPESLHACREAVRSTHVNLVDLVDIFDTRRKARIFPTVKALSEYTMEHEKFFPRDNAHAGNLLKFLLRQILNPGCHRPGGRRSRPKQLV